MIFAIRIAPIAILQLLQYLTKIVAQNLSDIPFVHHLYDVMQLDLVLFRYIGEVNGGNAELIKETAFDVAILIMIQDADATQISLWRFNDGSISGLVSYI